MAQTKGASKPAPPYSNSTSPHNDSSAPTATLDQPAVNRKKQKRRQKQAAKLAATQDDHVPHQVTPSPASASRKSPAVHLPLQPPSKSRQPLSIVSQTAQGAPDPDHPEDDDVYDTDDEEQAYSGAQVARANGYSLTSSLANEAKKKPKKKKKSSSSQAADSPLPHDLVGPASLNLHHQYHRGEKDRIWNTSTQEERERIKEFWQSLNEDERKSLVKIEKEAVLKKMKEQQKHSCSCSLCGRKRNAIEEELEVLYDAYYDELEQYAYDLGPGRPESNLLYENSLNLPNRYHPESRGQITELPDDAYDDEDDEDDEADYSEDYDDEYSQEDSESFQQASDLFHFGNSLTVKGGILTVADDLLKNDGKKFIEMMEQMAERRLQREAEAQSAAHTPYSAHEEEDDEDFEGDEEDDYNSLEGDEEDDDETDALTETQRMEEGRRMFQIFAARMFEQRVLTAYREKVAAERQAKLIEELEEEKSHDVQREAKKQRDAQKRKDKKNQQKQAKAEEKARKEAEKMAEEEAIKRQEEQKQEEARKKKEELRKKKEAERKAQEQEKARKDAERLKRQQEERERQQEVERKAREQKAQKEKAKEEVRRKAREEQEVKEKERKLQVEKNRRELEEKAKSERAAKDKITQEKEGHDKSRRETQKRVASSAAVAVPPSFQRNPSNFPSPHVPVATPALPKAPTPVRRTGSPQGSKGSSPKTPQPQMTLRKSTSPTSSSTQQLPLHILTKPSGQKPAGMSAPMQTMSPNAALSMHGILPPPGMQPFGFGTTMNGLPQGQAPPGLSGPNPPNLGPMFLQHGPPGSTQFRYPPSSMPQAPPGISGQSRAFPDPLQSISAQLSQIPMAHPPGFGHVGRDIKPSQPVQHTRQTSGSSGYEVPIGQGAPRPAPIQRPSSVKPHEQVGGVPGLDVDDLNTHLGSSALLGDADEPLPVDPRRTNAVPSMPRAGSNMSAFGASPLFAQQGPPGRIEPFGLSSATTPGSAWPTPHIGFGNSAISPAGTWSPAVGGGWPSQAPKANLTFPLGSTAAPARSRPLQLRVNICNFCRASVNSKLTTTDGFVELSTIIRNLEQTIVPPPNVAEILDICETEGTSNNGGGNFTVRMAQSPEKSLVRFEAPTLDSIAGPPGMERSGTVGDIGSPSLMHSVPSSMPPGLFPGLGANHPSGFH